MADLRACEQCGTLFEPRREHARFHSARCRAAWNRSKLGDSAPEASALHWSVAAMDDTADLLAGVGVQDRPKAVAVIGDMVWWVTIVDATLVRHHPEAYDRVLDGLPLRRRKRIEGLLGGLRFVRNRMREEAGCGFFIGPSPDGERWWWMPVPAPTTDSLPPRALDWEMTRYRAYSNHVAGRTTGYVFENVTAFLRQAITESEDGDLTLPCWVNVTVYSIFGVHSHIHPSRGAGGGGKMSGAASWGMPQFSGMDDHETAMRAYYERGRERERLSAGVGELEFARTTQIVSELLPPSPAIVADIGGGPGRYATWLASLGYTVEHRDLMPLHVAQLREDTTGTSGIRTSVGDARDLDLPDGSVDAALLLGPLYHLTDRADRVTALRECARITRPGGRVFAAAISRWAVRMDGLLKLRLYDALPHVLDAIEGVERTGVLPPLFEGDFTGYSHRPQELLSEMADAGLVAAEVVGVEGPAFMLTDLPERLADPTDRQVVLDAARTLGTVPELIGVGPHLLGIARV